jgi:histidinol phosphatase-like enzyme
MNAQALKASQTLERTGQITVIVQDNGPIHTSQLAQAQWPQWHQLKQHEIAARVITISGVQRRRQKKAYPSGQAKSPE